MINKTLAVLIGAGTLINCAMTMADSLPVVKVFNQIKVSDDQNPDFDTLIFNFYTSPNGQNGSSLTMGGYGQTGTVTWLDTDPSTFQFLSGYIYFMYQGSSYPELSPGPTCQFGLNRFVNNNTYNITVTADQQVTACDIQVISSSTSLNQNR